MNFSSVLVVNGGQPIAQRSWCGQIVVDAVGVSAQTGFIKRTGAGSLLGTDTNRGWSQQTV